MQRQEPPALDLAALVKSGVVRRTHNLPRPSSPTATASVRSTAGAAAAPGIRDGKRAVLDVHVSTDEQSASIEAQRDTCTRLANQHGYKIAGFIDENVSGAIAINKRHALKGALRALAEEPAFAGRATVNSSIVNRIGCQLRPRHPGDE